MSYWVNGQNNFEERGSALVRFVFELNFMHATQRLSYGCCGFWYGVWSVWCSWHTFCTQCRMELVVNLKHEETNLAAGTFQFFIESSFLHGVGFRFEFVHLPAQFSAIWHFFNKISRTAQDSFLLWNFSSSTTMSACSNWPYGLMESNDSQSFLTPPAFPLSSGPRQTCTMSSTADDTLKQRDKDGSDSRWASNTDGKFWCSHYYFKRNESSKVHI